MKRQQPRAADSARTAGRPTVRLAPRRIAFWASIVGAFASLGGNLTVLLLTGTANADSLIILLCWLASVGFLASTVRWAPLVSTALGAAIIGLFLASPYVQGHLTDPTGASGGFGVFAGDIVVLLCALLVFGGSLLTALEHKK